MDRGGVGTSAGPGRDGADDLSSLLVRLVGQLLEAAEHLEPVQATAEPVGKRPSYRSA